MRNEKCIEGGGDVGEGLCALPMRRLLQTCGETVGDDAHIVPSSRLPQTPRADNIRPLNSLSQPFG